ncbi:MAG TPA: GNAT family N-acetyltransferase [Jatrophihabitans sp.]|jgi:GNAT superfamily N-acetyltransferase
MTRASVRVRPAEAADVDALVTLISSVDTKSGVFSGRALVDPGVAHLAERLSEILDEEARTLLVAADDQTGELAGLVVSKMDEIGAIDMTPAVHVTHLLVAPPHRRRGVGRSLLAAVVHLADERGVDRVLATAASGSREANRYLSRLGFAPLVVHRVASTAALRRSLGISEVSERIALLRRARLARGQRNAAAVRQRGLIGRGA